MTIARLWTARATVEGAETYLRFFHDTLVPALGRIEGHRGAEVFTRVDATGSVEITVLTFWASMTAIAEFAGALPETAVVEPEARAMLREYDAKVRHLTLRVDTRAGADG